MAIKELLSSYEIGGIGEVKNKTIRFHSYECQPDQTNKEDILIRAIYEPDHQPKVLNGYPGGQDMLIDLCNLHLSMSGRTLAGSARIIAEWCAQHIHPYYIYEDELFNLDLHANAEKKDWDFDVNVLNFFSFSCRQMLSDLEKLYLNTISVFTLKYLMDGELSKARVLFTPVAADFEENLCEKWEHSDNNARNFISDKLLMNLPHLEMGAQYSFETGKILFLPFVRSVFDSAYYALTRFISVDAGATSDTGGKTTIAFCKACGSAFVKTGNRQKYCQSSQCQSIRNSRKSQDYYYRQKQK